MVSMQGSALGWESSINNYNQHRGGFSRVDGVPITTDMSNHLFILSADARVEGMKTNSLQHVSSSIFLINKIPKSTVSPQLVNSLKRATYTFMFKLCATDGHLRVHERTNTDEYATQPQTSHRRHRSRLPYFLQI